MEDRVHREALTPDNDTFRPARLVEHWQNFWFGRIPPHIYALLRIGFGLLGCASLLGRSDLSAFWALDGLVTADDGGMGVKAFLSGHGLGNAAGYGIYFASLASFGSMAVGFRSGTAVALALASSLVQLSWNYLSLSGAHSVVQVVLFCLVWADCGAVWSVDAWLERRTHSSFPDQHDDAPSAPAAPLRMIRFQIALIYLNSGLWKLFNTHWRDGSAVHYVLNNNVFERFPNLLTVRTEALATAATYATLLWELAFAFMILYRPTRRIALAAGVALHLCMLATLEVGLFHFVMLAGYAAFLDPLTVPSLPARFLARRRAPGRRARVPKTGEIATAQPPLHQGDQGIR